MDIAPIENKPIDEWFQPSYGRDGWKGLIKKIQTSVENQEDELSFEFQGIKEYKIILENN